MELLHHPNIENRSADSQGALYPGQRQHLDVVEISSDEEDDHPKRDDGQPESSRRTEQASPATKRVVNIDSDDEDLNIDLSTYYHFPDPWRMKRQKRDHAKGPVDFGYETDIFDFMDLIEADQPKNVTDKQDPGPQEPAASFDQASAADELTTLTLRPPASSNFRSPDSLVNPSDRHPKTNPDRSKKKPMIESQPYYDDPKLEVRMYCGPGYEKFPIVLGTHAEHFNTCKQWERQQVHSAKKQSREEAHQAELSSYINDTMDIDTSEDEHEKNSDTITMEQECLHKIREVLPNIDRDFALGKIRDEMVIRQCANAEGIQLVPDHEYLVSSILELPEYPKQQKAIAVKEPASDGTGITIEWQKGNGESKAYQTDAVCLLASQFHYVPTHFINKIVHEKKSLFESYLHIHQLDCNYDTHASKDRPYRRSHNPRLSLEKKYTVKEHPSRSKSAWSNLVNELQAGKQKVERDRLRKAKEKQEEAEEAANLQEHRISGNLVQCQCCFDDEIPVNRAGSCESTDGHWFCYACILGLAESQVGSMKHEMACMHESQCKATISQAAVARAIPSKLLEKLSFYQQQFEIMSACIEGLEQCPFCDFKAICDPIEDSPTFQCQNPDCQRVTCRKCHEDSHLPKSCEEAKIDRRISARHQVEEARSEAMMRACPRCKVKIVKEVGCNKMKCAQCGCVMCYVCKTDISSRKDGGYGHFHEPGAKCILYDKNFNRHEAEADEAEKAAIKKVQAENANIDEKQLQIETGIKKKEKQPVKHKDELGLGWGQAADEFPFLGFGVFENVYRQHAAHFDPFHERPAAIQRPRVKARLKEVRPAVELPRPAHPPPLELRTGIEPRVGTDGMGHGPGHKIELLHGNGTQVNPLPQQTRERIQNAMPAGGRVQAPPLPAPWIPPVQPTWNFHRHFPPEIRRWEEQGLLQPQNPAPRANPVHQLQTAGMAPFRPWLANDTAHALQHDALRHFEPPQTPPTPTPAREWHHNNANMGMGNVAAQRNLDLNMGFLNDARNLNANLQPDQRTRLEGWDAFANMFGNDGANDYMHFHQPGDAPTRGNNFPANAGFLNLGF